MAKIKIRKHLRDLSLYDFDDTVDSIIEVLKEFKTEFPEYELEIDASKSFDEVEVSLYGRILETDEEEYARENAAEIRKKNEEERKKQLELQKELNDKKEYTRLKKKFEGGK